eukprot:g29160.t1
MAEKNLSCFKHDLVSQPVTISLFLYENRWWGGSHEHGEVEFEVEVGAEIPMGNDVKKAVENTSVSITRGLRRHRFGRSRMYEKLARCGRAKVIIENAYE